VLIDVSRFLLLLLALALSGCAYSIQGSPAPGAASAPTSDGPKIPKTYDIGNADPCTFLTADDLKGIGPLKTDPRRQDDRIQQSCQFILNDGSDAGVTVVTASYISYAESKKKQPLGREVFVEKHSTWLTCTQQGADMVCTAVVAVHPERSLLVALALHGATEDKVASVLTPLASAALKRLPA
jgi:hypothetical protein